MRSTDFKLLICLAPRGYYIRGYSSSVITPEDPHMRSSNEFITPEVLAPEVIATAHHTTGSTAEDITPAHHTRGSTHEVIKWVITPEAPHLLITPEAPHLRLSHLLITPETLTSVAPTPEVITSEAIIKAH